MLREMRRGMWVSCGRWRRGRYEVRGSRFEVRGSRFEVRGSSWDANTGPAVEIYSAGGAVGWILSASPIAEMREAHAKA
jgi:hypothetical protein